MKEGIEAEEGPILFNAMKHHRGYIRTFINEAKSNDYTAEAIRKSLLKVGRLMIDLYLGDLTVSQIMKQVEDILKQEDAFYKQKYDAYIEAGRKNFRTVTLSDGSDWTLLKGREEGKYIHIHPSRYSKHTLRVRATALKTAVYLHIYYKHPIADRRLVSLTNEVRELYLKESPIKNEVYTTGLKRVLKLL